MLTYIVLCFVSISYALASDTSCLFSNSKESSRNPVVKKDIESAYSSRVKRFVTKHSKKRFSGVEHSFKYFSIKLPFDSTVLPFSGSSIEQEKDSLHFSAWSGKILKYDVDHGAMEIAVIPKSAYATTWQATVDAAVSSPGNILMREPDGAIYFDPSSKQLVALYHYYNAASSVHVLGRSVISGTVEAGRVHKGACVYAACTSGACLKEPVVFGDASGSAPQATKRVRCSSGCAVPCPVLSPCARAYSLSFLGSVLPRPPKTLHNESNPLKTVVCRYNQLRTLNPENMSTADTYVKAYSIADFGLNDAYVVWTAKKASGVLRADGSVIVPPRYCSLYVDTFGFVVTDDNAVGVLDFTGKTVLPCKYTLFSLNGDGLLTVGKQQDGQKAMQYGLYDMQKKQWVEPITP